MFQNELIPHLFRTEYRKIISVQLLQLSYSPVAALNRAYAIFKLHGAEPAIAAAMELPLDGNPFYHALLGELYLASDGGRARSHFIRALQCAKSGADKKLISDKLNQLAGLV